MPQDESLPGTSRDTAGLEVVIADILGPPADLLNGGVCFQGVCQCLAAAAGIRAGTLEATGNGEHQERDLPLNSRPHKDDGNNSILSNGCNSSIRELRVCRLGRRKN